MSKSLGNFFTVREIGEKYDLQVLRFFMLNAHYRSPLNFSAELMESSKNALERIITCVEQMKHLLETAAKTEMTENEQELTKEVQALVKKYEEAMEDDFNTADAIAAIFELVKFANTKADGESRLIAERQAARKEKNFKRADEIRDELAAMGIILKDTREGVQWKRA